MATQKAYAAGSELPPLEKDKLRLYSMRLCPYAQRALIVLAYKNIPYETVNINLSDKPAWFWDVNPLGLVPVIQKNDTVVYESLTVCEYLDEVYPGEKIIPADPYLRAKDKMFMERFSKLISKYYAFRPFVFGNDGTAKQELTKEIVSEYNMMESELKSRKSKFFGGDKPMLIDFAVWPHMERLIGLGTTYPPLSVSKDALPQLASWVDAVTAVPAVRGTIQTTDTYLGFIKSFIDGSPNYDYGLEEQQTTENNIFQYLAL